MTHLETLAKERLETKLQQLDPAFKIQCKSSRKAQEWRVWYDMGYFSFQSLFLMDRAVRGALQDCESVEDFMAHMAHDCQVC